jgi:hypothetical protein
MSKIDNEAPKSESEEALVEHQLEEVSGGLNPQPLPPCVPESDRF